MAGETLPRNEAKGTHSGPAKVACCACAAAKTSETQAGASPDVPKTKLKSYVQDMSASVALLLASRSCPVKRHGPDYHMIAI